MLILGAALACDRSGPSAGVSATGAAGTGNVATGAGGTMAIGAGGTMATGAGGTIATGAGGGAGRGVSTVAPAAFQYNGSISIVREK